ncbi:hypothetical protein RB594_007674 [Gaeumannomyces avenae]
MFSILPDLTPHDSHSLWYTSSRSPIPPASFDPANQHGSLLVEGGDGAQRHQHRRQHGGASQAVLERTVLARLRADETYQERRRLNVGNFGATWLKPPGIAKSLFQLREERREQEEHAEAVRREQLAQQLAEAEEGAAAAATAAAVAAAAAEEGGGGGMIGGNGQTMLGPGGEDEMMGDGDDDAQPEERDLDDEIPDADEEGFGYDGADSDEESDSDRTETTDDDDTEDGRGGNGGGGGGGPAAELRQVVAAEDRVLNMMSRGQGRRQDVDDLLYAGEEDEVDDEDRAEMLQEDDLAHHSRGYGHGLLDDDGDGLDMDMDGDLDDEIPEAESGMYEHTDTEASLMTSDDEHEHAERSYVAGQHPASARFMGASSARASHRSGNPRRSIDISSILSRDGSSIAGSSPNMMRRH